MRQRLFATNTKRQDICVGETIAGLWAVVSGPTLMRTKPADKRLSHWWCRCACGKELFIKDNVLKSLRDTPVLPTTYKNCRACRRAMYHLEDGGDMTLVAGSL